MSVISNRWIDDLPRDRMIAEFSVWSADLVRLADDLSRVDCYADILHIDVADGHFSPAMLFFPDLVGGVRKISARPIHVHLMVADGIILSQIEQFADAGADLISIHVENACVADAALDLLDRLGIAAGMVLKVDTPVEHVKPYLKRLRFVTLLGTTIGVKGQGLNDKASDRLLEASQLIDEAGVERRIILAADGGIREHTVPLLRQSRAETIVLGSLAFNAPSLDERMTWLREL
ncbi:ribulose-phosphate 3-epimerase [Rhizobium laguerreae]|uniref:ribulose-phosphate 3-epimerase n=1 Tax=Rhizobium laguerreae TaxID=1076926 RepID=UPI0014413384|nr:ribulose-phosphate 3-epimerase [Rhizobium laguerreae]MBY3238298.1 ribulose-phosphate 3-epimerase [Rhizobium laguerreae]MBY3280330.1 ribulose-phosphate 3-epimerase [Rhizobium laguerreae]NKM38571.1 D-allulose-6-phosphate 3-epimerase [Rhizobium laguerreae]NNH85889.1 ribulose-phosphate 3-epimerase [Rhizobium laguerreae]